MSAHCAGLAPGPASAHLVHFGAATTNDGVDGPADGTAAAYPDNEPTPATTASSGTTQRAAQRDFTMRQTLLTNPLRSRRIAASPRYRKLLPYQAPKSVSPADQAAIILRVKTRYCGERSSMFTTALASSLLKPTRQAQDRNRATGVAD
ncbi:hypothetical protein GCM10009753_77610 [Streptantibioticus ferralitis]